MADFYVIYHIGTGNILGLSTFQPIPENIPADYTYIGLDGELPKSINLWDRTLLVFVKDGVNYYPLTKLQFLERFTLEERIGIRSTTDPIVKDFMEMMTMAQEIDLFNPLVEQGLLYMTSINLLQPARVAEIMRV